MSSFCKCKSYSHFLSKSISVYDIFNDQSFNNMLTNNIVSFEQLGPEKLSTALISHLILQCIYPKYSYCQDSHNNPKYWDRLFWANSVDPDQMLQNAVSDQVLHCLLLIQQVLSTSKGSQMDLLNGIWSGSTLFAHAYLF